LGFFALARDPRRAELAKDHENQPFSVFLPQGNRSPFYSVIARFPAPQFFTAKVFKVEERVIIPR
jgi:hypothetical protein